MRSSRNRSAGRPSRRSCASIPAGTTANNFNNSPDIHTVILSNLYRKTIEMVGYAVSYLPTELQSKFEDFKVFYLGLSFELLDVYDSLKVIKGYRDCL